MGAEGFQATVGTRWLCSGFPWGRHFPQPAAPAVFTRILRRTGVCSFVWGCWPIGRRGDCRRQYRLWKTGGRSRSGGLGGIRTCRDGRLVHTGPAAMRRLGNLGAEGFQATVGTRWLCAGFHGGGTSHSPLRPRFSRGSFGGPGFVLSFGAAGRSAGGAIVGGNTGYGKRGGGHDRGDSAESGPAETGGSFTRDRRPCGAWAISAHSSAASNPARPMAMRHVVRPG